MFKILLRIFLGFLVAVLLVIGAIVGGGLWVYHHPERAWQFAHKHFLPADLQVSWSKIDAKFHHVGDWWHWDFSFMMSELEIRKEEPKLFVPIEDLQLRLSLEVSRKPKLTLHQVRVIASRPVEFTVPKDSKPSSKPSSPFESVRSGVGELDVLNDWMGIENLRLAAQELALTVGKDTYRIHAEVTKGGDRDDAFQILVETKNPVPAIQKAELRASVDPRKLKSDLPFVRAEIGIVGKDFDAEFKPTIAFAKSGDLELLSSGGAMFKGKKPRAVVQLSAHLTRDQLEIGTNAHALNLPGPLAQVQKVVAHVSVPLDPEKTWAPEASKLSVRAPVKLFFVDKNMREPFEKACKCNIPEFILASLDADLYAANYFSPESPQKKPMADAHLKLAGLTNTLITLDMAARLQVARKDKDFVFDPSLDSTLLIHSAQGLIKYLNAKNVMIPAPFDVLDGEIELDARGPFVYSANPTPTFTTPINVNVDLKSKAQVIKLKATTDFKADTQFKNIDVHVKTKIDMFQVELPPLEPVAGIPHMTEDSRLKEKPDGQKKQKKGHTKLTLTAQIETASKGAVRLLSALAKPYVPITIQAAQVLPPKSDGFVRVEPFALTYLRRTVQVENVTVNLKPVSPGSYPLKGRLRVDQTNYKVFIDLGGTTTAPQYTLTSDPWLGQDDVISVLLFDQTTEELGTADAESQGNFQAALADRAIGLFGLWLFASTPIRSFNYNPVTKIYSASVQVGGGVIASVGTNWDQAAQLELRKRLSRHWVVSASYAPSPTDGSEVGQLQLQWERRF